MTAHLERVRWAYLHHRAQAFEREADAAEAAAKAAVEIHETHVQARGRPDLQGVGGRVLGVHRVCSVAVKPVIIPNSGM
jgi:hypothetical protein